MKPQGFVEQRERLFFCPDLAGRGDLPLCLPLPPEESRHALKVLRLEPGRDLRLFDGQGFFYEGRLLPVEKRGEARVEALRRESEIPQSPGKVTLAVAALKPKKADLVLQKAVELGVERLCFFPAQRSVARYSQKNDPQLRWESQVVAACKQCGRARLMQTDWVEKAQALPELLPPGENTYLYGETAEQDTRLYPPLSGQAVAAVIGPEGGFTSDELAFFETAGWRRAGLGPQVLRAETAAIAAATLLQYLQGRLGGICA